MIFNVIKKYPQNAITKTIAESVSGEIPNIETKYFRLSFIGICSKVTQSKIENFVNDFEKMPRLN